MRKKIATALVCFAFCIAADTTGTTFAHNHQSFVSEVTDANGMMIDDESVTRNFNKHKLPEVKCKTDSTVEKSFMEDTIRQQKSNQTHVVRRVTYYYPTGNPTSTGHSAKGHERIIALSPDLLKLIPYHSKVEVVGYGIFTVEDRTASYIHSTVDILVPKGTKIKNGQNVVIRVIT